MPLVQDIKSLREITEDYDVFIIDLWGVIHDGIHIFPSALNVLKELKQAHKYVYLMTNNSQTTQENILKLIDMGLAPSLYTELISAGQKCIEMFLNVKFLPQIPRPLKAVVLEYGLICSWTDLVQVQRVEAFDQADFILGFHILENNIEMTIYEPLLKEALKNNLPFLCANPDFYATRNKERFARVGLLAKTYEHMGGTVVYVGKPYPAIYENILKNHSQQKILMIGDSLITDIKGANDRGIDGMLVSAGNHNDELSGIAPKDLTVFFDQKGIVPHFIIPHLIW